MRQYIQACALEKIRRGAAATTVCFVVSFVTMRPPLGSMRVRENVQHIIIITKIIYTVFILSLITGWRHNCLEILLKDFPQLHGLVVCRQQKARLVLALAPTNLHTHTHIDHRHRHRHRQTDRQTDRQTHAHAHAHVSLVTKPQIIAGTVRPYFVNLLFDFQALEIVELGLVTLELGVKLVLRQRFFARLFRRL